MIEIVKKRKAKIKIYRETQRKREKIGKIKINYAESKFSDISGLIRWVKKTIAPDIVKSLICKRALVYAEDNGGLIRKLAGKINKQKGVEVVEDVVINIDVIC